MQSPLLQIIKCTAKEIPDILSVAVQSYREHYTYLWTDNGESYIGRNFTFHVIKEELAKEKSYFYLLALENEPVGFFKVNDEKPMASYLAEECLELERIYLLEKVSGKGIGTRVMDFVQLLAKENRRNMIWLKAMHSSLAVKFYEKIGFETIDAMRLDFPYMKDEYRTILLMKKEL